MTGLLGEVHLEKLDNGRVRCVETRHEMPEAHGRDYASTKKCKAALFEKAVAEGKGPLRFFQQSSTAKDKIVCQLTGASLNKTEEAVWKHMTGKKFCRILEEKEAEKAKQSAEFTSSRQDETMSEQPLSSGAAKRKEKRKERRKLGKEKEEGAGQGANAPQEDGSDASEPDFWVPSVGHRWDNDTGEDRWGSPAVSRRVSKPGVEDMREDEMDGTPSETELDKEDVEMDAEDSTSDFEVVEELRTKRTALAVGPSNFAGKKKKKKKKCEV